MPKKTKQEKLTTDQRRMHSPSLFQFTAQINELTNAPEAHRTNGDIALIRKDLLKTVILAMCAIGSEVFLAKIIR